MSPIIPTAAASALVVLALVAGACADSNDAAAPEPTAAPTATTGPAPTATPQPTSTPAPTATPVPTPTAEPFTFPLVLDNAAMVEAANTLADVPVVERRATTSTSTADGTTTFESVSVRELVAGDRRTGHAEFEGAQTIYVARAARNAPLAEALLSGVDYMVDGTRVIIPRSLAATLDVGIDEEGAPWVSVDRSALDTREEFALALLAPFRELELVAETDTDDELQSPRTDITDGIATYTSQVDGSDIEVRVDDTGALRGLAITSTQMFSGQPVRFELLREFDPVEDPAPEIVPADETPDVTEAIAEYVARRYAEAPESLGG